MKNKIVFRPRELDRIIEMAWEDRTSFDVIKKQFGIAEKDVKCPELFLLKIAKLLLGLSSV